jgi:hypothetical protein
MPPCVAADPFTTADPFAASRTAFDALLVELGGDGAARLGHAELEEVLDLRGRELLRQLYQDHRELRRLREELAVGAHPAPGPARTASPAGRSSPATSGCWPPFSGR